MAEQKGIIRIKGKIGDLSFYQGNGKDFVKTPGGATKSQIMSNPKFVRLRENMTEFGGSAHVGRAFRHGLADVLDVMSGRSLSGRVTGMFKAVCSHGSGTRGERKFEIVANKSIMIGFNFNNNKRLSSIFSPMYTYTVNVGRNETELFVPDFNVSDYVHAPEGATHFRLVNSASVLSDYKYDPTLKTYNATDPTIDGLNMVKYSGYIEVTGMVGMDTTVTATIAGAPVMTASAGLIGCIGIEFFQFVNGDYYLLNAENSLRLENVF